MTSRWINVDEDLPPNDMNCLVYGPVQDYSGESDYRISQGRFNSRKGWYSRGVEEVLYWADLPPVPNIEEAEV